MVYINIHHSQGGRIGGEEQAGELGRYMIHINTVMNSERWCIGISRYSFDATAPLGNPSSLSFRQVFQDEIPTLGICTP